ncbi:P-loop containing nucleoside triphosphate hydrolase protein [Xylariomycetidae sp. FL2044]|nr:P-loop containing nucleoside triphosphate hydrolase protein [Xylariomycetidae sp. FL2044]
MASTTLGRRTPAEEWKEKKQKGEQNATLDELMGMIGLESVKSKFLELKADIGIAKDQNRDLTKDRFTTVFLGNPGTGKTTVARLYSDFLKSLQIFGNRRWTYKEISGVLLAEGGVRGLKKLIDDITENDGVGAVFVDETYQLVSGNSPDGRSVLDYLITALEDHKGEVVFIFAGYRDDMEKFYSHNKGLRGRIAYTFKFDDYDEAQLQEILKSQIETKWGPGMRLPRFEGHAADHGFQNQQKTADPEFLLKIVARRIGVGRNREGFANARAVENALSLISNRMSRRLDQERTIAERNGTWPPDLFQLTQSDMLGPSPTEGWHSEAWRQLESMIGLKAVKDEFKSLVTRIGLNRSRELRDEIPLSSSLNKVFLGNPGTGKTTVAKLYGQVLVDLGLLSNGEVVVKTAADFIGAHLGESERNTKAILDSTKGKVLVIDEAYQLGSKGGAQGMHGVTSIYNIAVIDTLVANVHSQAGDDRCVLLLGYKDKMEEMFQDSNSGLKRRFPLDEAFVFEDFTNDELRQIWRYKLKQRDLRANDQVENIVSELLERRRHKLNFGNAGEIDIIIDTAQGNYQKRAQVDVALLRQPVTLQPSDIDPDFERVTKAAHDVDELFKGVIGCDDIKKVIGNWPKLAQNARKFKLDVHDQVPMTLCFTGPPGTGKTTTAKNIGKVMYSLGLLASNEVNVISASELVGEFIGHTGPKVRRQFESSLGRVLFIDEAYRLRNSSFGKEAIDEIVTCLTEDKFKNHLVVILAGYEQEIDHLLSLNPGMASRVQEKLKFPPLSAEDATKLLELHIHKDVFHARCLRGGCMNSIVNAMRNLVTLPTWASGRSVDTLSKRIKSATLREDHAGPTISVSRETVISQIKLLKTELEHQAGVVSGGRPLIPQYHLPEADMGATRVDAPLTQNRTTPNSNRDPSRSDLADRPEPIHSHATLLKRRLKYPRTNNEGATKKRKPKQENSPDRNRQLQHPAHIAGLTRHEPSQTIQSQAPKLNTIKLQYLNERDSREYLHDLCDDNHDHEDPKPEDPETVRE